MTDTPRHLALYLPSLRGGGAERVMLTLANGFAAQGHRVDLVLVRREGEYLAEVAPGVRVVDLGRKRAITSLLPLARYLRRERPDAMLASLSHTNLVAIWARMLARANTRLVVSEHSSPSAGLRRGGKAPMIYRLMRRFYPRTDAVVAVSQAMRQEMIDLLGLSPDLLHAIWNPMDLDRIRRMMVETPAHDWLTRHDLPVIVAVGRLTAAKDYPTLLQAFARLRQDKAARLIILGQGELEGELRTLADTLGVADAVDFAGFQPNPFAFMHEADLFVMSSAWEGLPNTLIEALACGVPVVSTDCPTGPHEILEGGKWGRLVPVGDAEALAAAMGAALGEERVPDEGAAERFAVEGIVERYLEVSGAP